MLVALVCTVVGCQNKQKNDPMATQAADYGMQPDYYAGTVDTQPATSDYAASTDYTSSAGNTYSTGSTYSTGAEPAYLASTTSTASTSRNTHIVTRGDTLYRIARQYYSDQSRWKEIYDANRGTRSSPHKLSVGQQLLIP